jgi:hypothetical protein
MLRNAAKEFTMRSSIKSAVTLGAMAAFSLLSNLNPAAAQLPSKRLESMKDRAVTPTSSGLSSRRTAERFAVLLPSRIVNYAEGRKGKKVDAAGRTLEGNADVPAECTDLVKAALDQAGAKPGDFTDPNNYVWGKLEPRRLSRPGTTGARYVITYGDIIQFESCVFRKPDGSYTWTMGTPHHTAIVKSVNSSVVTLLHQNAPRGGPVREETLDLGWVTTGTYKVYTPIPK